MWPCTASVSPTSQISLSPRVNSGLSVSTSIREAGMLLSLTDASLKRMTLMKDPVSSVCTWEGQRHCVVLIPDHIIPMWILCSLDT